MREIEAVDFIQRAQERERICDRNSCNIELLRRNRIFLAEHEGAVKRLGKDFFDIKMLASRKQQCDEMARRNFPKVKFFEREHWARERDSFFNDYDMDMHPISDLRMAKNPEMIAGARQMVFWNYESKWERFCFRWGIDSDWDGDLNNLADYIETIYEIWTDKGEFPLCISIKISPWTRLKDLEEAWPQIEGIQKTIRSESRESYTFGRDLFWYDLRKEGWSYGKIARHWAECFPEEIKFMAAKKLTKRHKGLLGKRKKEQDIKGLIDELESNDEHIKELIEEYIEYKKDYSRTYYSNLIEIIKKAIRNMTKKIDNYPSPKHKETAGMVGDGPWSTGLVKKGER